MKKLAHFITYNNLVPITISMVLLGTTATYAYNNSEIVYDRSERVVTIDNTYIAGIDFDAFSPSVQILSVAEDDDTYYVAYRLTTIALVDSVWQNVTSNEELVIPKVNLGTYRDLGLYVTQELRELVLSEEKRLRETQVFEKRNVTRKQLVVEYSGLIGGRLSPEMQTIAGYDPQVTPPRENQERQTFAGPDARSTVSKPIEISSLVSADPPRTPPTDEVDQSSATTTPVATTTVAAATTTSTTTPVTPTPPSASGGTGGGGVSPDEPVLGATSTVPEITLLGASTIQRIVGESYDELGIVISDTSDGEFTTEITVNAATVTEVVISTSQPGEYRITYLVTNQTGGSATVSRLVQIVLPAPEVVEELISTTTPTITATTTITTTTNNEQTTPASDPEPVVEAAPEQSQESGESTPSETANENKESDAVNEGEEGI